MTYAEKLKLPQWQKKRLEILNKNGWICWSCGEKEKQLHVHHLKYKHNTEPWDYPDENFIVLCEDCHNLAHDIINNTNEEPTDKEYFEFIYQRLVDYGELKIYKFMVYLQKIISKL